MKAKLGNKARKDKAYSEVLNLIKNNPMSAKEISQARGTKLSHNLLRGMKQLGLIRKYESIKKDRYHIVLWIAVNKQISTIKPRSVFEMNILAIAA